MKTGAIIRLVVCIIIIVILVSVLAVALAMPDSWSFGGFSFGGYVYGDSDEYSVGGFTLDDYSEIREIEINWVSGAVNIDDQTGDEPNKFTVSEQGGNGDSNALRWRIKDGKLTIKFRKSAYSFFANTPSKQLYVHIPSELMENLKELKIDTVSAEIACNAAADTVKIDNVSGKINLDVACNTLDIDSVSGDMNIKGKLENLDIDNVSGDVSFTSSTAPSSIKFDSVSGDGTFNVGECTGFTAKFDSVSGDFSSSLPLTSDGKKRIYGDGSASYNFNTVSGDISVN